MLNNMFYDSSATISDTEAVVFDNLLFFEREVTRPQIVKQEIDIIMPKLRKIGVNHKNIVISKVIRTDPIRKTMTVQIHIPLKTNERLKQFFCDNLQYTLEHSFVIQKGVKLVISNSEREFRAGIQRLMELRPGFDMKNNPIIELSHISFDGRVLGFELFLEDNA